MMSKALKIPQTTMEYKDYKACNQLYKASLKRVKQRLSQEDNKEKLLVEEEGIDGIGIPRTSSRNEMERYDGFQDDVKLVAEKKYKPVAQSPEGGVGSISME